MGYELCTSWISNENCAICRHEWAYRIHTGSTAGCSVETQHKGSYNRCSNTVFHEKSLTEFGKYKIYMFIKKISAIMVLQIQFTTYL